MQNSDSDSAPDGALRAASQPLRAGDVEAALEAFTSLSATYPDSWGVARGLQDSRRASMPVGEFEAAYLAQVEADPESALAWYLLGRARIDRTSEARAAFEKAAALAPTNPWPPVGIAYLYFAVGDMYLCVETYEAAIERMPRSARLRLLLGNQLLNLRLVIDAQRHLEFGHRLAPEDPMMTGALGKVYVELGRAESGRALLEEAWAAEPTQPDVAMSLAVVYLRDREAIRSEQMYRLALEWGATPDEDLFGAIRAAKVVERARAE